MRDVSLNILDVAVNSVKADASLIVIRIVFGREKGYSVSIADDGKGMDGQTAERLAEGKLPRHGISLMKEAAEAFGGGIRIESREGEGTVITADFPEAPFGTLRNTGGTVMTLAANERGAGVVFQAERCGSVYKTDSFTGGYTAESTTFPQRMLKLRNEVENGLKDLIGGFD